MTTVRISPQAANGDFETIARFVVAGEGLPFASVLPPKEIGAIFRRHQALFGQTYNAIYTTAIVLWAFLC
ncbi:MAG TPA: hypothetical protein EYH34_02950, partial [Planctomycetes bacterium]|nr:hypothetical protein [Planctomycetota bacterium]